MGEGRIFRPPCTKFRPKPPLAAVGELEQLLLVHLHERALEHYGGIEIVVRQQRKAPGGDHVHHRQMVGQHYAVAAGDRDIPVLECAHHFLGEDAAAPDQDEDITGADWPALRLERHIARDPALHGVGDLLGQSHFRIARRQLVQGRIPGCVVVGRHFAHWCPQLDQAGIFGARRQMANGAVVPAQAVGGGST